MKKIIISLFFLSMIILFAFQKPTSLGDGVEDGPSIIVPEFEEAVRDVPVGNNSSIRGPLDFADRM